MHNLFAGDGVVEVDLALGAEFDDAFLESVEGVVGADADIFAGHDVRAALAHDDGADERHRPVIHLYPQVFGI